MTDSNGNAITPVETGNSAYRPEDVQEMFGIKQRAYYNRLKFLGIEANKDEQGKPYLNLEQVELLKALHEHINETGKMEGFTHSALVKKENHQLSQSPEAIYAEPEEPTAQFDLEELVREAAELKAREIAIPDLVKRAVADRMSEEDLPEDLKEKVKLAREAANPKFTPAEVAETLLNRWRSRRSGS
jgi:hypothetical protein